METANPQSIDTPDTATIVMPKPTAWPMVLALAIALIAAGVAINLFLSLFGLAVAGVALGGWIQQLLPGRGEIDEPRVAIELRAHPVARSTKRVSVERAGMPGHRIHFPEKVHPYSAGAKGGFVGGVLMIVVATAYGWVSGRGVWYPVNLLAAMILTRFSFANPESLNQFDGVALFVGLAIHVALSIGVGLLFGIILPTLPRSPVFWGGVVGPLLWTGAIYSFMGVLNPVMNQLVDWPWFLASQFAYGLAVGTVVAQTEKIAAKKMEGRDEDPEA